MNNILLRIIKYKNINQSMYALQAAFSGKYITLSTSNSLESIKNSVAIEWTPEEDHIVLFTAQIT